MSQATRIQDEPSMEEILASIRRIIEDSDPGQAPAHPAKAVANDHVAAVSRSEDTRREGTAGDVEGAAARPVAEAAVRPRVVAPEPVMERAMPETPAKEPEMESAASVSPATPRADAGRPESPAPAAAAAPAEPPVQPEAPRAERVATPSAVLISQETSRKVAAAFGDLSAAVDETRRRGVEKMAREMLRPMLQEWLDKNLSGLVEEMVQKEIRRITSEVEE